MLLPKGGDIPVFFTCGLYQWLIFNPYWKSIIHNNLITALHLFKYPAKLNSIREALGLVGK